MSWSALEWASKQKVGSSPRKFVLVTLANFCDDENKCFPSIKTIIKMTELSESTVKRCIKDLIDAKLILKEERFENLSGEITRQTSNMYYLQVDTHGVQSDTHPSITMKPHITTNKEPNIYTKDFDDWWNVYPRKAGSKNKAFTIYKKIIDKEIDKDELYSKTIKYKQSVHGTEQRFIPHPTTWLNGKRWEIIEEKDNTVNLNQLVG